MPQDTYKSRLRLSESVRELIEKLILADDEANFAQASELVLQATQLLDKNVSQWQPKIVEPDTSNRDPRNYFPYSPIVGPLNPQSALVSFKLDQGVISGTVKFSVAHQGPPGCVHGGVLAEFFDDLLGASNIATGIGGLTGKLTVKFRATTPIYKELRFQAMSSPPVGRKIVATGSIWNGEVLCCEAEGVFITVDAEKFRQITVGVHD